MQGHNNSKGFDILLAAMHDKILNEINRIEREEDVKVILACETGSRAWGFASPDSDYDVRLIYVHRPEWYISVFEQKDALEYMSDDGLLDLTGWDLIKVFKLLQKSNAALLERLQSPIVYTSDEESRSKIWLCAKDYFNPKATMHHYFGLTKTAMADLEGRHEIKLKKLFYALRAVMACRWIRLHGSVPHIEFQKVYSGVNLESNFVHRLEELIVLKSGRNEDYMHPTDKDMIDFITGELAESEACFNSLGVRKEEAPDLNFHFRNIIQTIWHG